MTSDGRGDCRLSDLLQVKHGFAFRSAFFRDDPPGDILLTPGNFAIGGGFKSDKLKYYSGPVPEEYVLAEGDLLVTMTDLSKGGDTLGYPALVPRPGDARYLHNQRLGKVVLKSGAPVERRFLYYLLCTREYRHEVLAGATGSTVRHTSPERIARFQFHLPPLDQQRAIAHVLGSLDDKIELNRRMNETMEAMAQAIFRSWFADFDPVRAKAEGRQPIGMDAATAALFADSFEESVLVEIPQGWHCSALADCIDMLGGGTPSTDVPEYWGGGIPWISARDVTGAPGIYVTATERAITRAGVENSSTRVLPKDTTVITARGTVGAVALTGTDMAMNQTCYAISGKPGFGPLYTFLALRQQVSALRQNTHGTIFDTITRETFKRVSVAVPGEQLRNLFETTVRPMADLILANQYQSQTLAAIRDALLPKLMSGEVRVSEARSIAEARV